MYTDVFTVGLIMAMSKQLTSMGIAKKLIPLINLFFGIGFSIAFNLDKGVQEALVRGLIIGLSTNGFYDLGKVVKK